MRGRLLLETRRLHSKKTLSNARAAWTERTHLLLTIVDEAGRRGTGEAAPLAGHSRETVEEAASELASLGEIALPEGPPENLVEWLRDASAPLAHASSRFALETALLDWAGRVAARPAASLLGAPDGSMDLCAVIDGPPAEWSARIKEATARGYRTLKLKVSPLTLEAALETVSRERTDVRWRLDANGSLPPALLAPLRDLAALFEAIEEPCAPELAVEGLPLALDETLVRGDWEAVARQQRARFVVLKPMALGGIAATLDLAARARALGLGVIVSYLWEGPIGWAASIAIALAAGDRSLAQGLAPHRQLASWPSFVVDAVDGPLVRTTPAPGLGLRWSESP